MSGEYLGNERINCGILGYKVTLYQKWTLTSGTTFKSLSQVNFKSFLLLSPVRLAGSKKKAERRDL